MRALFARLHLATHVGGSPAAVRGVRQTRAQTRVETAQAWAKQATTTGEVRAIMGAGDEPCFAQMRLGCLALHTGYLWRAEVAAERTSTTGQALVEERLKALGAPVLSGGRDRAKALMQLADQGLACLSRPDCFHLVPELVTGASLALGRRVPHAHKALADAQGARARLPEQPQATPDAPAARGFGETRQAAVTRGAAGHPTSRRLRARLSDTRPPCRIPDSPPQTSAHVASQLSTTLEASAVFAPDHQGPARPPALPQGRKQGAAMAALGDCWGQGVQQAVAPFLLAPRWRQGVHACLLPRTYWGYQGARTRCRRRKATLQGAWEAGHAAFPPQALTQRLPPRVLAAWQAWAADRGKAFQRASSAVEGRNGSLSHMHHKQRGLPKRRSKGWTVLHHVDSRAAEGPTPASRFCGQGFPDLLETVFAHIED